MNYIVIDKYETRIEVSENMTPDNHEAWHDYMLYQWLEQHVGDVRIVSEEMLDDVEKNYSCISKRKTDAK